MLCLLQISLLRFLSELTSLLVTFSYINRQCSRHLRSRKTELCKLAWTFLSDVTLTTKLQSKRPGTAHARYSLAVLSCKLQTSERHCWVTKQFFGWSPIASKESVFCSWRNKVCIFTTVQQKSFILQLNQKIVTLSYLVAALVEAWVLFVHLKMSEFKITC